MQQGDEGALGEERRRGAPAHRRTVHRASRRSRRRARNAERTRGQRWRRRIIATFCGLLVAVPAIGGAGWWYVNYKLDQIHHVRIGAGILRDSKPGAPFNVVLIGSDSRQFENKNGSSQFGSASVVQGQRSDVVIIARVVPAERQVYLLSIPRDTMVNIPGNIPDISGQNRINAAFNNGPSLLIKTIKANFGIPIDHFAEVNFAGFQGMVDAVGGIKIDFPDRLKDAYSDLSIDHTGCQLIHGSEALAYVRSRHLYYLSDGAWNYDGLSDWSRIRRQDVFFHALLQRVKGEVTNPIAMNDLLGSVVKNLTLDSTFSNSELLSLAYHFRHAGVGSIHSEVMPTVPYVTSGGADVLLQAPGPDKVMISRFLAYGSKAAQARHEAPTTTAPSPQSTTTTTSPPASSSPVVYDTQPEPWNGTPC